jgi:hypothetical protein
MKIFAVLCFMVITSEPLILNMRCLTESNAKTSASDVGGIAYKSEVTCIVRTHCFELLTYTN